MGWKDSSGDGLQDLTGMEAWKCRIPVQGFFSAGMLSYVWGKLYRREFLEQHELRFRDYVYAEDKMFSMQCYVREPVYAFVRETGYIYRKNEASVSYRYREDFRKCWPQIAHDLESFLEKQRRTEYEDLVRYTIFFAAFLMQKWSTSARKIFKGSLENIENVWRRSSCQKKFSDICIWERSGKTKGKIVEYDDKRICDSHASASVSAACSRNHASG